VFKLARIKLTCDRDTDNSAELDYSASLAALSQRLQLQIEPSTSAVRKLEQQLVASYLRTVFVVPNHREFMRTGTPSEPILAEAAASFMQRKTPRVDALKTLQAFFNENGLAAKGDRGELVGRLLDIFAIDSAIQEVALRTGRSSPGSRGLFNKPISVKDYLACLISKDQLPQVLKAKPCNPQDIDPRLAEISLEDMFQDAWVHATHYSKAEDSSVLDSKYIWAYWVRGTAVSLKVGQELSDRMIPVH
jgi:hypothetical protein